MKRPAVIPQFVILAPDGRRMPWTHAQTAERAITKLLGRLRALWPFARGQGYQLERLF